MKSALQAASGVSFERRSQEGNKTFAALSFFFFCPAVGTRLTERRSRANAEVVGGGGARMLGWLSIRLGIYRARRRAHLFALCARYYEALERFSRNR